MGAHSWEPARCGGGGGETNRVASAMASLWVAVLAAWARRGRRQRSLRVGVRVIVLIPSAVLRSSVLPAGFPLVSQSLSRCTFPIFGAYPPPCLLLSFFLIRPARTSQSCQLLGAFPQTRLRRAAMSVHGNQPWVRRAGEEGVGREGWGVGRRWLVLLSACCERAQVGSVPNCFGVGGRRRADFGAGIDVSVLPPVPAAMDDIRGVCSRSAANRASSTPTRANPSITFIARGAHRSSRSARTCMSRGDVMLQCSEIGWSFIPRSGCPA